DRRRAGGERLRPGVRHLTPPRRRPGRGRPRSPARRDGEPTARHPDVATGTVGRPGAPAARRPPTARVPGPARPRPARTDALTSLCRPRAVVGAHTRELRDLLAPQPRHTAAVDGHPHVLVAAAAHGVPGG